MPTHTPNGWCSRLTVDTARDVLECIAHQESRDAASVFDVFQSAVSAAFRFGQSLAVLARDQRADALEVFLNQLTVAEE